MNDYLNGRQSRAAVVTANPFVRGVITALSWFNADMKGFTPEDVDSALRHLQVRETELMLVKHEIQLLRKRLGYDGLRSIVAA
ncbi:Hypothetical protein A7982_00172 [Minicystis rosea]|nr:Hypothetical protein A7982_00172 [Minicystis rosea]